MIKKLIILLALVTVSCVSDDGPCHDFVLIVNNSDSTIYYGVNSEPLVGADPSLSGSYFKIMPHSTKKQLYGGERGCYENLFNQHDILYFNIFDAEIVDSEDWETIRENDMILQRFQFTVEEMNTADWKVVYNE